jgi:hypothetical protein
VTTVVRQAMLVAAMAAFWAVPAVQAQGEDKTFYRDILPVFQKYCIDCHRVGGTAPQSLETYDLARSWLRTARLMMRERSMPPWFADPAVGHWRNAVLPTDEEIALVADWIGAGAEPGDEADAPPAPDRSADWKLGEPDLILQTPETVAIAKGQPDTYRSFVLDPGFDQATWLSAIELKPGSLEVVRELSLSIVPPELAANLPAAAFDPASLPAGVHEIAVWNRGMSLIEPYPEGSGVRIPAGWKLVLHAHYKAVETAGSDRSSVGLHRAEAKPQAEYVTVTVAQRDFTLPADSYDYEVSASATLEQGLRVESILPRMHYLGLTLDAKATLPDGSTQPLIRIRDYDFRMQTLYSAAEPIELPAGTRIDVRAYYENSPDNPRNPNTRMGVVGYGPAPEGEVMGLVLRGVAR